VRPKWFRTKQSYRDCRMRFAPDFYTQKYEPIQNASFLRLPIDPCGVKMQASFY
jgi:hypothetical protein